MTQTAEQIPPVEMTEEDIFAEEVERRRTGAPAEAALSPTDPPADPPPDDPPADPPPDDPPADPPQQVDGEQGATQQVVEDDKPAWYAALDDEAKAAFDSMNTDLTDVRQQYTALHGRLAPMQQANERLREQVEHAGQRPPQAPQNSSATSGQQPGQIATGPTPVLDLDTVPEFAEFKEAFPEEAKAIAALFGRQAQSVDNLQEQLGNVSQGLQQIQQASFGQQREVSLNKLAEAHPDWMQVRPSEDFGQWLQTQPRNVASMADSPNADDCIYVLDRYKQDVWAQQQLDRAATPQPPANQETAQTVRQRRRQIRSVPGLDPQGGDVGSPLGAPQEFQSDEDIFAAEVARRLRAQRDARSNY